MGVSLTEMPRETLEAEFVKVYERAEQLQKQVFDLEVAHVRELAAIYRERRERRWITTLWPWHTT